MTDPQIAALTKRVEELEQRLSTLEREALRSGLAAANRQRAEAAAAGENQGQQSR